jgi:hypothetical protein
VVTANKENLHLQVALVSLHCTRKRAGKRPVTETNVIKVERHLFTVHQTPAKQATLHTTDSAQNSANSFDVGKLGIIFFCSL